MLVLIKMEVDYGTMCYNVNLILRKTVQLKTGFSESTFEYTSQSVHTLLPFYSTPSQGSWQHTKASLRHMSHRKMIKG